MLTGFFKDRHNSRLGPPRTPELALGRLLRAKSLNGAQFARRAVIGPFMVDYVCQAKALIVEFTDAEQRLYGDVRTDARSCFLAQLGYRVVQVTRKEVLRLPDKVIARVRHALEEIQGLAPPNVK